MAAESLKLAPLENMNDAELLNFMTTNADAVQKKVLEEILTRNASTKYLQRYNLGGFTDRETFKAKLPVITYDDIKPDIERIANGDHSPIHTAKPISEFLASSGTSGGERKLIPFTEEDDDRHLILQRLIAPVLKLHDKGKGLHFLFVKSATKTAGGIIAQPTLTSFYKSERFKRYYNGFTSLLAAILCPDTDQSMYVQMLCGLLQRLDVVSISAVFAAGLVRAIRFLKRNWQELCTDITAGKLSSKITDISVRDSVLGLLEPNPELSQFIVEECSKGDWAEIITRLWPNTKYLETVVTGSMARYIPALEYYSGGLPMCSKIYASSECFLGVNLRPMCNPSDISYTIMPIVAYFEFIPVSSDGNSSQTVDLINVKVGEEYEVLVTTYSGLYRYLLGDILRVTGFYNNAPQFAFVRRKDVLLSIDADKTNEAELQKAVDAASALLNSFNASVVDYTSNANVKTLPGHYVIYFELLIRSSSAVIPDGAMEQCCLAMENALNAVYRQYRVADKSIGPLEIRVVSDGTFDALTEYAMSRGASLNQYKVRRCVSSAPIVELLDSRVVSSHFSPALPEWSPHHRSG